MKQKLMKQVALLFGINVVENFILLFLLNLEIDTKLFVAIIIFSISETLILNRTKIFH